MKRESENWGNRWHDQKNRIKIYVRENGMEFSFSLSFSLSLSQSLSYSLEFSLAYFLSLGGRQQQAGGRRPAAPRLAVDRRMGTGAQAHREWTVDGSTGRLSGRAGTTKGPRSEGTCTLHCVF